MTASNNINISDPNPADVLEAVKHLKTHGVVEQHWCTGVVWMDVEDDFIFKSLEVLYDYGFTAPPFYHFPMGTSLPHVKIVNQSEAEDMTGKLEDKVIVEFRVVGAFIFRHEGLEMFLIQVESAELDRIRKDLTGLPPPDQGFCINVGERLVDVENEEKPETKTNTKP